MEEMTASQARENLPEALNRVAYGGDRIRIKRRGKVLAALVSAEDLKLLEELEDRYWAREAEKALEEFKKSGEKAIPWEEVKASLGL